MQDASGNAFRKIMLIDPMGNFMMEYDSQPDPELVLKDVKRLLTISRIG
jgi:cytochrome oxidase Cu insertion factor (SCO1/SenC/PrrC family)